MLIRDLAARAATHRRDGVSRILWRLVVARPRFLPTGLRALLTGKR